MLSQLRGAALLILTSAVLFLSACNNDDSGSITGPSGITPDNNLTTIPGQPVQVRIEVSNGLDFAGIEYTVNNGDRQTFPVTIGTPSESFVAVFVFETPATALLDEQYDLDIFLINNDGSESAAIEALVTIGPRIQVPATYNFVRDGFTTVSFSGQTDRLNQVSEMTSYVKTGHTDQTLLSADVLNDMFRNTNDNGGGNFSFVSDRQLANKTFAPDVSFYEGIFDQAAAASQNAVNQIAAAEGTGGLIARASGATILVNDKGHEFAQLVEKGLMGAVFYNQIYNVYMTDVRVGDDVENVALREGKNYTDMEHHWDEAFGYFGVPQDYPTDFPEAGTSEDRFWAKYTFDRDELIPVNDELMGAYIAGRAAIVNRDYATKDASRDEIYRLHELVTAATAVHYINTSLDALDQGEVGELFHQLSEAYMFVNALKFSPNSQITLDQIDTIINTDFGTDADFWNVTAAGLTNARNTLAGIYSEIEPVATAL